MPQPAYEQLVEIIAEKDRHIAKLQARATQLEARIAQLEQLLERATRTRKRQVQELLGDALALRHRRDEETISPHGLTVARPT